MSESDDSKGSAGPAPQPIEGLWEPSGPLRPAPPLQTLPARFGRYVLKQRIGVGGMAEVFLASQDGPAGFTKAVVVKRILPHLAEDPSFIAMFQREANVAAALNHVHVVQINELGDVDGQYFIAMEYVDGLTLHRLARRAWRAGKSLPTEIVVGAIADAALGLHHAHEARDASGQSLGLVHRDVSPENLMITKDGITKVLDFGIARGKTSATKTGTGELKGKIPFLAPEQVADEPIDGRADLYALGVTMYWLLTGRRPFHGTSELMLLSAKLTQRAEPPSVHNAAVPKVLDDIVLRLLEREPSARFANGLELHDALSPLAPVRTQLAAPYVREVMALPHEDSNYETGQDDEQGFLPSQPVTTRFGSAHGGDESGPTPIATPQMRAVMDAIERPRRRATTLGVAVGAGFAIVLGALLFVVGVQPGGQPPGEPPTPLVVVPAAADAPPPIPTPPDPGALVGAPGPGAAVVEQDPADPPPDEAPPTPPDLVDEPVVVGRKPARIELKAPASISWQTLRGKPLGRGNGNAEVPAGTRAVVALDGRLKGRTTVPVTGGVADFTAVPRGTLDVRALPYAEVFVGDEKLGLTPFAPKSLPAGTYKVRLVYEDKDDRRTVEIKGGRTERITVDFRKK